MTDLDVDFDAELGRLAARDRNTDMRSEEGVIAHYSTLGVDAREMVQAGMSYLKASAVAWPDVYANLALSLAGRMFEIGLKAGREKWPYQDGDTTVIGPECFIAGKTISYKGQNYTLRNGQ